MPSDKLIESIIPHLEAAGEPFRNAVATTVQQVRRIIADHEDFRTGAVDHSKAELGDFAANRIDVAKFAAVISRPDSMDAAMLEVVERSLTVLEVVETMLENVFQVDVAPGTSAERAVGDALEQIGLAFGAARAVGLAKAGGHTEEQHRHLLDGIPFRAWSKSERLIAPPLLLRVAGMGLEAASLAQFMDGAFKLVVVPHGRCAPAPLVRLITPRTFVIQTHDPEAMRAFAKWTGPGIALVAEDSAHFVHDPTAGTRLQDRLTVGILPANPKQSLGGISVRQQLEELEQLRTLANVSQAPVTTGDNGKKPDSDLPPDPADKLAAWLMNQARDISAV